MLKKIAKKYQELQRGQGSKLSLTRSTRLTLRVVQTHKASSLTPFSSFKNGGEALVRIQTLQNTNLGLKNTSYFPSKGVGMAELVFVFDVSQ